MNSLKLIGVSFITIIILDYVWLGLIMNKFYTENLSVIARIQDGKILPVYWAAAIVYVLLAVGIVYFVLPKLGSDTGFLNVFLTGALMGLIIYGVYDMTNYATLKDFPVNLAFADMAWGATVTGLSTLATTVVRDL